jgi:hypothetical protein
MSGDPVRRRSVVRAATWAVPGVTAVAIAPAYAAFSGQCPADGEQSPWVEARLTQDPDYCDDPPAHTTFAGPFSFFLQGDLSMSHVADVVAIELSRFDTSNGNYDPFTALNGWTASQASTTTQGYGDLNTTVSSAQTTENGVTYVPIVRMTYRISGGDAPAGGCVYTTEFVFGMGCA